MKYLKIILGNFKKDLIGNIIMIVFVTFAVFLMNISLSEYSYQEYLNGFVKNCGLYDDYIYIGSPLKSIPSEDGESHWYEQRQAVNEYITKRLDVMQSEGIVENSFSTYQDHKNVNGSSAMVIAHVLYPREFVLDIKFPVSRGRWFEESDFEGEYTPVVLGSDYLGKHRLGDIIPIEYWTDKDKGDEVHNCVVIGFLKQGTLLLTTGASGTDMGVNDVFSQGDSAIVIAADNVISYSGTRVIKVSPQNQQRVVDELFDVTPCFTFKYMADEAYENNRMLTETQSLIFILMMIVCIAGVSSGNLLGTIAAKKKYAIYFMCGMNWKTGVWATLAENVLKLVLPAAAGYAMFLNWAAEHGYYCQRITVVNPILTIVFLILIFLLTSLMPLMDIRRTAPVKIISES